MSSLEPSQDIIKIENLELTLLSEAGEVKILKKIDLSIKKGEAVGIIGPSGAGKSSLMMVIAGLERPTSGAVYIDNNDIAKMNEDELALFRRDNIGIIFQDFHLIPTMQAIENIAVPLELAGDAETFEKALEALTAMGLQARAKHYPSELSGGEQQRIAIARAIITKPQIILADEPTGNLDHENGEKIINLIFDLQKKNNTTLILITHDLNIAKKCNRIIKIEDGMIIH